MDPIDLLKAHARQIRACHFPTVALSHGHTLEIAVALTSTAHSWNEFSAHPTAPVLPVSIEGYFAAIAIAQRRLLSLQVAPALSRGMRSWAAMKYLAAMAATPQQPLATLRGLLDAAEVPSVSVQPPELADEPGVIIHRLASWFFLKKLGLSRKFGDYPWDHTERLALQMGFSRNEAATIRELQREAPNHGWELSLWCEVGVLDADQRAFLQELKEQPHWQREFRELYESDGGTVSIDQ